MCLTETYEPISSIVCEQFTKLFCNFPPIAALWWSLRDNGVLPKLLCLEPEGVVQRKKTPMIIEVTILATSIEPKTVCFFSTNRAC